MERFGENILILGAGFTGLGVSLVSGIPAMEAKDAPGGICASYYREGYRFEVGGGHWIFGGDPLVLKLFDRLTPLHYYERRSAVFFTGGLEATAPYAGKFVDYPLQNHLYQLGEQAAQRALQDLLNEQRNGVVPKTMQEWLRKNFGEYLCRIFFEPFHQRYTAGLYTQIMPQDPYKTPFRLSDVVTGSFSKTVQKVGYNVRFAYPQEGLDQLAYRLAQIGSVSYEKIAVAIDPQEKIVTFADGTTHSYDMLVSTLPLNRLLEMCGAEIFHQPYTSVLVLNLGVELPATERAQHGYHWLYIPDSRTGFHRVGYYSNVDPSFLPEKYRNNRAYGSLYVEFAFRGGQKPGERRICELTEQTIAELQDLGLIGRVHIADPTWIDVAYTWQTEPNAVKTARQWLQQRDIYSIGRYGRWTFQGIAESFQEGQHFGAALLALSRIGAGR